MARYSARNNKRCKKSCHGRRHGSKSRGEKENETNGAWNSLTTLRLDTWRNSRFISAPSFHVVISYREMCDNLQNSRNFRNYRPLVLDPPKNFKDVTTHIFLTVVSCSYFYLWVKVRGDRIYVRYLLKYRLSNALLLNKIWAFRGSRITWNPND